MCVCTGDVMQLDRCYCLILASHHLYQGSDSISAVLVFCMCTQVTLMQAYEYIQRMRADMRGTNLLGALSWVYQQPMQRSYPRQVFIITDGSITNVAKVLELVRRNTCAGRYSARTQLEDRKWKHEQNGH